jgi:hypothetical protein
MIRKTLAYRVVLHYESNKRMNMIKNLNRKKLFSVVIKLDLIYQL